MISHMLALIVMIAGVPSLAAAQAVRAGVVSPTPSWRRLPRDYGVWPMRLIGALALFLGIQSAHAYDYAQLSLGSMGVATIPGQVTSVEINGPITGNSLSTSYLDGWTATITLAQMATGGTFNGVYQGYFSNGGLSADTTTPMVTFNVTRPCYNSSLSVTNCSKKVYGTVPVRYPFPASYGGTGGTVAWQQWAAGSSANLVIALSDYIEPGDVVTMDALPAFYTDSSAVSNLAVTGFPVTNLSGGGYFANTYNGAGETYPVGRWLTEPGQRWASGGSFTTAFVAAHRFPLNGATVKAVQFVAKDTAGHSVSHTATSQGIWTGQLVAHCSATQGSNVLTSCDSTAHFFAGDRLTVVPNNSLNSVLIELNASPILISDTSNSMTVGQSQFTASLSSGAATLNISAFSATDATTGLPIQAGVWLGEWINGPGLPSGGVQITAFPSGACTHSAGSCATTGIYTISANATANETSQSYTDVAGASDSVSVYAGQPVYDYEATFSSSDQASLNQGPIAVEAIVYPNYGTATLDTQNAFGGPVSTTCKVHTSVTQWLLTDCGSVAGFHFGQHVNVTGFGSTDPVDSRPNGDAYVYYEPTDPNVTSNCPSGHTPCLALDINAGSQWSVSDGSIVTVAIGTAASSVTANLRNLQAYNDVNGTYTNGAVCAWVDGSGAGTPTVQQGSNCSTYPGSSIAYASIKAAADALKTYNNSNSTPTHNDACGATIYVVSSITRGSESGMGSGGDVPRPSSCFVPLTIRGASGGTIGTPVTITANATATNNSWGYNTAITDLVVSSGSGYSVDVESDNTTSSGTTAPAGPPEMKSLHIYRYDTLQINGTCPYMIYETALARFEGVMYDGRACTGGITATPNTSYTQSFEQYESTIYGKPGGKVELHSSIGDFYYGLGMQLNAQGTTPHASVDHGVFIAFDKVTKSCCATPNGFYVNTGPGPTALPITAMMDWAVIQSIVEDYGPTTGAAAFNVYAENNISPIHNGLIVNSMVWGNRSITDYQEVGSIVDEATLFKIYTVDAFIGHKIDTYSGGDGTTEYGLQGNPTPTVTGNTGCAGTLDGTLISFQTPTGNPPATKTGVTQTGTLHFSGGSYTLSLTTYTVDGVAQPNGIGYSTSSISTGAIGGDAGCTPTFTYTGVLLGHGSRTGAWQPVFGVGSIGQTTTCGSCTSQNPYPAPMSWMGEYIGRAGTPFTLGSQNWGYWAEATSGLGNVDVFDDNTSNVNDIAGTSVGGGDGTGLVGFYHTTVTGFANRTPANMAAFPGDLYARPRAGDGTGCAGIAECATIANMASLPNGCIYGASGDQCPGSGPYGTFQDVTFFANSGGTAGDAAQSGQTYVVASVSAQITAGGELTLDSGSLGLGAAVGLTIEDDFTHIPGGVYLSSCLDGTPSTTCQHWQLSQTTFTTPHETMWLVARPNNSYCGVDYKCGVRSNVTLVDPATITNLKPSSACLANLDTEWATGGSDCRAQPCTIGSQFCISSGTYAGYQACVYFDPKSNADAAQTQGYGVPKYYFQNVGAFYPSTAVGPHFGGLNNGLGYNDGSGYGGASGTASPIILCYDPAAETVDISNLELAATGGHAATQVFGYVNTGSVASYKVHDNHFVMDAENSNYATQASINAAGGSPFNFSAGGSSLPAGREMFEWNTVDLKATDPCCNSAGAGNQGDTVTTQQAAANISPVSLASGFSDAADDPGILIDHNALLNNQAHVYGNSPGSYNYVKASVTATAASTTLTGFPGSSTTTDSGGPLVAITNTGANNLYYSLTGTATVGVNTVTPGQTVQVGSGGASSISAIADTGNTTTLLVEHWTTTTFAANFVKGMHYRSPNGHGEDSSSPAASSHRLYNIEYAEATQASTLQAIYHFNPGVAVGPITNIGNVLITNRIGGGGTFTDSTVSESIGVTVGSGGLLTINSIANNTMPGYGANLIGPGISLNNTGSSLWKLVSGAGVGSTWRYDTGNAINWNSNTYNTASWPSGNTTSERVSLINNDGDICLRNTTTVAGHYYPAASTEFASVSVTTGDSSITLANQDKNGFHKHTFWNTGSQTIYYAFDGAAVSGTNPITSNSSVELDGTGYTTIHFTTASGSSTAWDYGFQADTQGYAVAAGTGTLTGTECYSGDSAQTAGSALHFASASGSSSHGGNIAGLATGYVVAASAGAMSIDVGGQQMQMAPLAVNVAGFYNEGVGRYNSTDSPYMSNPTAGFVSTDGNLNGNMVAEWNANFYRPIYNMGNWYDQTGVAANQVWSSAGAVCVNNLGGSSSAVFSGNASMTYSAGANPGPLTPAGASQDPLSNTWSTNIGTGCL